MKYLKGISRINVKKEIRIKVYPMCGRDYCYCIKDTKLGNKKNKEFYFKCYRHWCLSRF